jgi:hypothetical protein
MLAFPKSNAVALPYSTYTEQLLGIPARPYFPIPESILTFKEAFGKVRMT